MGCLRTNEKIEAVLNEQVYPIAGLLPRYNMLLRNIASGDKWNKYLREKQRAQFVTLFESLWKVYREMLKGTFTNLWK